jgi:hypothetical protein
MSATTRKRLERTARIVAGGNCPHALVRKSSSAGVVFCEKNVDPLTGEHADGAVYHCADGARTAWWLEDDIGAFIE